MCVYVKKICMYVYVLCIFFISKPCLPNKQLLPVAVDCPGTCMELFSLLLVFVCLFASWLQQSATVKVGMLCWQMPLKSDTLWDWPGWATEAKLFSPSVHDEPTMWPFGNRAELFLASLIPSVLISRAVRIMILNSPWGHHRVKMEGRVLSRTVGFLPCPPARVNFRAQSH